MRKQLYLDINNRLKTVQDANGEQLFKHVDLWNRQVEFIEQEAPFACPAVFIEFNPMSWRTQGNRVQDCDLTVRLHIVTERLDEVTGDSPTEEQALAFFDIINQAVAVLQGFSTSYMNGWMRTKSITNHDHEQYVDNVEEYTCNLRDVPAVKKGFVVAKPNLNIVVKGGCLQ